MRRKSNVRSSCRNILSFGPPILPSFRKIDYVYPDMNRPASPDRPYNSKNVRLDVEGSSSENICAVIRLLAESG